MRFIQNSLRGLESVKLTIICLAVSFVLVTGGTYYQIDNGLLAAQKKFFASWGLLLFRCIPFPGMKTVAIVLVVNLLLNGLRSFSFTAKKTGVLLMHLGIIVLFAGTAIASMHTKESVLTIFEGQRASFSRDFSLWELIVIKKQYNSTNRGGVVSDTIHVHNLKNSGRISFPKTSITLSINRLYQNCDALSFSAGQIDSLKSKKISGDQAGNFPGIEATVIDGSSNVQSEGRLVLYGGNVDPVIFLMGGDTVYFMLKPHEVTLPIEITLNRFITTNHPGTTDAKNFESHVTVQGGGINRDAVITMNRPFRYKSLTFYQNGFMTQNNVNATTLFVVDNSFRLVPYVSGLIIIAGMMINFIGKFTVSVVSLKRNNHVR